VVTDWRKFNPEWGRGPQREELIKDLFTKFQSTRLEIYYQANIELPTVHACLKFFHGDPLTIT